VRAVGAEVEATDGSDVAEAVAAVEVPAGVDATTW